MKNIDDISQYQCGKLPANAQKLDTPATMDEMMKKSLPIAVILCTVMFLTLFIKTFTNKVLAIFPPAVLGGVLIGFLLLIVHGLLHAIAYPSVAEVSIGKLKGKMVWVALASFPLKRSIVFSLIKNIPQAAGSANITTQSKQRFNKNLYLSYSPLLI